MSELSHLLVSHFSFMKDVSISSSLEMNGNSICGILVILDVIVAIGYLSFIEFLNLPISRVKLTLLTNLY